MWNAYITECQERAVLIACPHQDRQNRRLSPKSATVAKTGDCRRIRRQIVARNRRLYSLQCGQGLREGAGAGTHNQNSICPLCSAQTQCQMVVLRTLAFSGVDIEI